VATVFHGLNLEAGFLQEGPQHFARDAIVVGDQNFHAARGGGKRALQCAQVSIGTIPNALNQ